MKSIKKIDTDNIMNTYKRQNVVLESGFSATAIDENGKKYIDFTSGIGVNSLGYSNPDWSAAVSSQAQTLQHASNLYYTKPAALLAKKLTTLTGYKKVFFGNSGAEANECAIKIARKYSFDKYGENRYNILTLKNSFHGRTVTTLSATGQDVFHNYFFPFTDGFYYAVANDINETIALLEKGGFCSVIVEFIQGEGGVVPLEKSYVQKLFSYCESHDILTVADEVQTGISRTGTLLCSENYGVMPNVTTLAKGLGGGLPIGACLADEKCQSVLSYGEHGTTFGGNPVVCAGANVVIEKVSKKSFLSAVIKKGEYIKNRLEECSEIEEITGMGLMLGLKLKTKKANEVLNDCLINGLIVLTAKEKIRLLPPLSITQSELKKGMDILVKLLSC